MPAIIDSAPSCITSVDGAKPADDSADFILQKAYENCAGFMTFGPGSTYGEDGAAAATSYYVLTWIGILVTLAVLVYWVMWEDKRLRGWVTGRSAAPTEPTGSTGPTAE